MALDATTKELLNKFADTQVALNDRTKPRGQSEIRIGDLVDQGVKAWDAQGAALVSATYSFDDLGGAVGSYELDMDLPKDAIITRMYTRTLTTLDSGGLATVELLAGAQSLKAATAFSSTDFTGVVDQTDAGNDSTVAVPILVANTSKLTFTIATADLTDGEIKIWVEYLKA